MNPCPHIFRLAEARVAGEEVAGALGAVDPT